MGDGVMHKTLAQVLVFLALMALLVAGSVCRANRRSRENADQILGESRARHDPAEFSSLTDD
jgi:hypothetical protein